MAYQIKNYKRLLGMPGFSETLLKNHFKLYEGYVQNTNKFLERFQSEPKNDGALSPEMSELRRRFGWEFNGMRLHEYYFENMAKEIHKQAQDSLIAKKLSLEFDSYERWQKDFQDVGGMRGIGWTLLCYDGGEDHFFNVWINEHDTGHLAGLSILLVMDVFEHAFMLDYGVKKKDYIEAFFKAIDWQAVDQRYALACGNSASTGGSNGTNLLK